MLSALAFRSLTEVLVSLGTNILLIILILGFAAAGVGMMFKEIVVPMFMQFRKGSWTYRFFS
jgi:hypothetical protein